MSLTSRQREVLLRDLHPSRVAHVRAAGGMMLSHLEAWDVRAHLNRIFGFGGWDETDTGLGTVLLYETETTPGTESRGAARARWSVAYRATRRLTVRDADGCPLCRYEATAVGESTNQPVRGDAHDMAIKTAESQALKRAAINLGTQFGLSLYRDGQVEDVVRATLVPGKEDLDPREEEVTLAGPRGGDPDADH